MSMLDFLRGKWLKHPLHPILAHLPTALFPAALVFDVISRAGGGNNVAVRTAFYCIAVGLLAVLGAVPTGLADWSQIKRDKPAWKIGLWHMGLNAVAAVVFLVNLVARWPDHRTGVRVGVWPLVLSAVGTAVLLVSGYLGGRMIYDQGVGVGRESKHHWRRVAAASGARVAEE